MFKVACEETFGVKCEVEVEQILLKLLLLLFNAVLKDSWEGFRLSDVDLAEVECAPLSKDNDIFCNVR